MHRRAAALAITEVLVCTTCRPAGADRAQPAAGSLPRSDRPERLRAGLLLRLPPLLAAPAQTVGTDDGSLTP